MAGKPLQTNDFDPAEFLKHDDIKALSDRVEALEKKVINQEGFSDTFCAVHARDINIRKEITKNLSDFIRTDAGFQLGLTEVVRKIDRGYTAAFVGKIGFAVWSIFVVIVTSTITQCTSSYFSKPLAQISSQTETKNTP